MPSASTGSRTSANRPAPAFSAGKDNLACIQQWRSTPTVWGTSFANCAHPISQPEVPSTMPRSNTLSWWPVCQPSVKERHVTSMRLPQNRWGPVIPVSCLAEKRAGNPLSAINLATQRSPQFLSLSVRAMRAQYISRGHDRIPRRLTSSSPRPRFRVSASASMDMVRSVNR